MKCSVTGPWRFFESVTDGDDLVVLEVADTVDSRGNLWEESAWRVTVNDKRPKQFYGESAWSDSQRLFRDVCHGLALH